MTNTTVTTNRLDRQSNNETGVEKAFQVRNWHSVVNKTKGHAGSNRDGVEITLERLNAIQKRRNSSLESTTAPYFRNDLGSTFSHGKLILYYLRCRLSISITD